MKIPRAVLEHHKLICDGEFKRARQYEQEHRKELNEFTTTPQYTAWLESMPREDIIKELKYDCYTTEQIRACVNNVETIVNSYQNRWYKNRYKEKPENN